MKHTCSSRYVNGISICLKYALVKSFSFFSKVLPQLAIGSGHDLTLEFNWSNGNLYRNYTDVIGVGQNPTKTDTTFMEPQNITSL